MNEWKRTAQFFADEIYNKSSLASDRNINNIWKPTQRIFVVMVRPSQSLILKMRKQHTEIK